MKKTNHYLKEELDKILEDFIIRNKETDNVYSVKKVNPEKHEPLDIDAKGNPIDRDKGEASEKARQIHKTSFADKKKQISDKEFQEKKAAKLRAVNLAIENPKKELDSFDTIYTDKNHPFYIPIRDVIKDMKKVTNEPATTETSEKLKFNGRKLIESIEKKGNLRDKDIEMMNNLIDTFSNSTVDSGISEYNANKILIKSISRVLFQEDESRNHGMGDHGIRHIYGNMHYTRDALNTLSESNKSITPRQKFMAQLVLINHDLGYATSESRKPGMEGINATSAHKEVGSIIMDYDFKEGLFKNMGFSKDETDFMVNAIKTHDSTELDFDEKPVLSSIRLSDNISVFKKEKMPYAFDVLGDKDSQYSLEQLRKQNLHAESIENKLLDLYLNGKLDGEKYNDNLVRLKTKHKELQNKIKANLINTVNKKTELKDFENKYVLNAINEINPWNAKNNLGIWAGNIKEKDGITFGKSEEGKTRAEVHIEHNKFNSLLSQAGLNLGNSKFLKMLESFGIEKPKEPASNDKEELTKYQNDLKKFNKQVNAGKIGTQNILIDVSKKVKEDLDNTIQNKTKAIQKARQRQKDMQANEKKKQDRQKIVIKQKEDDLRDLQNKKNTAKT